MWASGKRCSATQTQTPCRATRRSSTVESRRHTAVTRNSWTARNRRRLNPRSAQLLPDVYLELTNAAIERRRQPARDDLLQRRRQQLLQLGHRFVWAGQLQPLV